jgi:hypothetical protein
MTSDGQLADDFRYAWAHRHKISKVAYAISGHVRDGKPITKDEGRELHDCLALVYQVLEEATVERLAPEGETEEEALLRYASYDTYGDGTRVATLRREPGSEADPLPPDYFELSIEEQGPVPRGWEVVIDQPPHRRGPTS